MKPGIQLEIPSPSPSSPELDIDIDAGEFVATKKKIHDFFNNISPELQSSVPKNIHTVIEGLTFFDTEVTGKFSFNGSNKPEQFLKVPFNRKTQIAYDKSTFIKRSIVNINVQHEIQLSAICSFVMEIAMHKYAYDELKLRGDFKIHIPQIITYGIEPNNNCVVTMERIPTSYKTLYDFLNGVPVPHTSRTSASVRRSSRSSVSSRSSMRHRRLLLPSAIKHAYRDRHIQILKIIANQLSIAFNAIGIMHNDAHLNNIYINDKYEVFVIDFGRAEMGIKKIPLLYPRTANSLPTFHTNQSSKTYDRDIQAFIDANRNRGNTGDMVFVTSPRLGGKRHTRKVSKRKSRSR